MTADQCRELIDSYVEWLRSGLSAEQIGESCELTTPFLDRHNDHLQLYATRSNGKIVLTDDGYTLSDLRTSGFSPDTPKRRQLLEATLNGFGVKADGEQLTVEASPRTLGQRTHSLVQAMLAVNDLFALAQPRVASLFYEDVKQFLDAHDVRYSERVKLAGRTGFDHAIDFLIPRSRARPERLVQAINSPQRSTISAFLFTLSDTRAGRLNGSEAFVFLNDRDRDVPGDVVEALGSYEVVPALWSAREQHAEALAA